MQVVPMGFRFTFAHLKFNSWIVEPKNELQRTRASVVCFYGGCLLTIKLEDPVSKVVRPFPPGGALEVGETLEQAAIRETLEETGYQVELDPKEPLTAIYPFPWGAQIIQCRTTFFKARLLNLKSEPVNDASYHRGVFWLPEKLIHSTFAYHSTLLNSILAMQ